MDLQRFGSELISAIVWTIISTALLFGASLAFDRLHPIEFRRSIGDGNVAVGIVLGSIILALGVIIASLVRA